MEDTGVKSSRLVETIEGILSIHQEHAFSLGALVDFLHCIDGCFTVSRVSCAGLLGASR